MQSRAHVFIYGDVTGVGFRFWAVAQAKKLGLTGWVRNASRDMVEAVFKGDKDKVEKMMSLCRKGPEVAWVERVEVQWQETKDEFQSFEIVY